MQRHSMIYLFYLSERLNVRIYNALKESKEGNPTFLFMWMQNTAFDFRAGILSNSIQWLGQNTPKQKIRFYSVSVWQLLTQPGSTFSVCCCFSISERINTTILQKCLFTWCILEKTQCHSHHQGRALRLYKKIPHLVCLLYKFFILPMDVFRRRVDTLD